MKKFTRIFSALFVAVLFSTSLFAQTQEVSPFCPFAKPAVSTTDATWDILFSWNVLNGGEQAIESDGQFLYTAKWSANGYINKYDIAGVKLDSFQITGVGAGIRDLAYDGTYFYGGKNAGIIYKMNFAATPPALAGQVTASGVANVRHLTYSPIGNSGAGSFWCGGWADMFEVSLTGSQLGSAPGLGLTGVYGTAYDGVTAGGPYLWLFDQGGGVGTPQLIQQFKISNKTLTGVTHDVSDIPGYDPAAAIGGGLASNIGIVAGKLVLLASVQQTPNLVAAYELALATGTGNNQKIENIVKVFPNPATDLVKIKSGLYVIDQLTVTNNMGQVVFEGSNGTNNFEINTSNWETGIYFVNVQTVEGSKTYKLNVQ